jgi:hypothetical protein
MLSSCPYLPVSFQFPASARYIICDFALGKTCCTKLNFNNLNFNAGHASERTQPQPLLAIIDKIEDLLE